MIEVYVESLRINLQTQRRVLFLKDKLAPRFLAYVVGAFEADEVAIVMQGIEPQHPHTHDSWLATIIAAGGRCRMAVIDRLENEILLAKLHVLMNGQDVVINLRPSDAIAIAVRARIPLFVDETVMERAGLPWEALRQDEPAASRFEALKVFISYSHKDRRWLDRLQVHLKPLQRLGVVDAWDDTRIRLGADWRTEIRKALASAKVAVLLVSADFLASEFIATNELPPLLAQVQAGGAVLPVVVSPCRFSETSEISRYQAANDPSKPLNSLSRHKQEEILVRVSRSVEAVLTS
jgi:bifunctional DNase/RNase